MILLEEIQNDAVDSKRDLGTLLRKCKLLAARLGSQPLEDWLIWESNGYPQDIEVPEYRIWPLEVYGKFQGPFGKGWDNVPIPNAFLPKDVQGSYKRWSCRQSISSIETILKENKDSMVTIDAKGLSFRIGSKFIQDCNCIYTWAAFSETHLIELLNTVRNRILDFTLAVWKERSTAGISTDQESPPEQTERITQIFNNKIYGGAVNIAATVQDSVITLNVAENDFEGLKRILKDNEVSPKDIEDLKVALDFDPKPSSQTSFGPKVSEWISRMTKKAADGGWSIGLGAAGNLLAQAISKFYGF